MRAPIRTAFSLLLAALALAACMRFDTGRDFTADGPLNKPVAQPTAGRQAAPEVL